MRHRRRVRLTAVLVIAGLVVAGCARLPEAPPDPSGARVSPIEGEEVNQVVLAEDAIRNLGIETTPVIQVALPKVRPRSLTPTGARGATPTRTPTAKTSRASTGTASSRTPEVKAAVLKIIPLKALIYDPQGKTWTYIERSPRTFVRAPVTVQRIAGGTVYLSSGPPAGALVVTVGAPELLGSEYGVGEE
jgi:hypothetical protein